MSNNKKIKVISGKGKNIKISDIKDHLNIEKPKEDENKKNNIIIPKKNKK